MIAIFLVFALLASLVFYRSLSVDFDGHYGALHVTAAQMLDTLIVLSIKINLVFFTMMAAGVVVLAILFSHRIAGPLFRLKQFTRLPENQRLHSTIQFRQRDAIHIMADSLNRVTQGYNDRLNHIMTLLASRGEDLEQLSASNDKSTQQKLTNEIRKISEGIQQDIATLQI